MFVTVYYFRTVNCKMDTNGTFYLKTLKIIFFSISNCIQPKINWINLRHYVIKHITSRYTIIKERNAVCHIILTMLCLYLCTGYCTYFDTADDRIKGLYAADCSKYQNPCPTRYHSTKAFLCVLTFFISVSNIYKKTNTYISY